MRTHIFGTGLILGLAVTVFGGPVAWADNAEHSENPGNNAVTLFLDAPDEPLAPGQEIHIQGHCPDPDAGPLTSDALTGIEVLHDRQSGPPNLNASGVVAEATAVHEDAEPGEHPVTAQCAGAVLVTTITVLDMPADGTDQTGTDQTGTGPGAGEGQVSRVPRGAPETGADHPGAGQQVSLPMLVLGLALGAAAGAGAVAWREARR